MEGTIRITLVLALAFFLMIVGAAAASAQETAGQQLSKLSKLPPQERQQALIAGAKAEGEVTWYSSTQAVQIGPIAKAFNQRFPFITVNRYRVSGQKQVVKIQSEYRADTHLVDVVNGAAAQAYSLKELGILDPYQSPQRKFYAAAHRDKDGYFTPAYVIPVIFAYNTQLVEPGELPGSYQELLDPKWKGRMLLDTEEFYVYFVLSEKWGMEKARHYMKQLAKQDLRLIRGRTSQTQLLMAGERSLAIALHGHSVLDFKAKGGPIDWRILDPFFAKANMTMLAKHAPHPHAAALFIDWLLSEEGQSMITSFGRVTAHKGVKQRFPEMVEKEYELIKPAMIGPALGEISHEFREIFMGG